MYVDIDFECLKPFDVLFEQFDFITALPGWRATGLPNGFIACVPGHTIIKACLDNLVQNYREQTVIKDANFGIFDRSGPNYFTRCFLEVVSTCKDRVVVLPASYMYPFPPLENRSYRTQAFMWLWTKPEAFANHYWSSSWLRAW